jgi:steroid 5-alpha reductase family enzyme
MSNYRLMKAPAYNAFGWVSQGTWIFLQGACLWHVHHSATAQGELGALDVVGIVIFFAGLVTEHVADMQKTAFNAEIKSGRNAR